jgi:hypothetical protein
VTQSDFHQILTSIDGLSPDQMRRLARELESRMAAATGISDGRDAEDTAFDVASRAGLIGCIKGAPRSPTDLSTKPAHMEGFGLFATS